MTIIGVILILFALGLIVLVPLIIILVAFGFTTL